MSELDLIKQRLDAAKTTDERLQIVFEQIEQHENNPEKLEQFYDIWASVYDSDVELKQTKIAVLICDYVDEFLGSSKDKPILDLGAGTGRLGNDLTKRGYTNIDAVDGSKAMLEIAKRRGCYKKTYAEMLRANEKVKFAPEGTYDCIVGCAVFYAGHLTGDKHLKQIMLLLKPGGYLIISTCPHDGDAKLQMEPTTESLNKAGLLEVTRKTFMENMFDDEHGYVWVLQRK